MEIAYRLEILPRANHFVKTHSLLFMALYIEIFLPRAAVIKSHFNFDTCRPCYAKSIFYGFRGSNYCFSTFHGRYSCRS